MSTILLWLITLLLFAFGFAGIIIPGLPGLALIFGAVLFYAWITNFAVISSTTVVVVGVVALAACLAEWYGSALGTKLGGGKSRAFFGTLAGGLVGLFIASIPGLFIGAFIGAFAGALAEGNDAAGAVKIAAMSLIGILGAKVFQLVVAAGIFIAFLIAVFF